MQTPSLPPAPPTPPALPGAGGSGVPRVVTPGAPLPIQGRTLEQLRSIRSELSSQLTSASGRRDELADQLQEALARGATGAEVEGLQQRIAQLDARIITIEGDIAAIGREVAVAASDEDQAAFFSGAAVADNPFGLAPGQVTGISIVFILFVLAPLAWAAARSMLRRANRPAPPPALPAESAQRLERLEQGMDAVAIEVERISEGQRFVTRLLTESRAQPVPVAQRLAEPVAGGGRE